MSPNFTLSVDDHSKMLDLKIQTLRIQDYKNLPLIKCKFQFNISKKVQKTAFERSLGGLKQTRIIFKRIFKDNSGNKLNLSALNTIFLNLFQDKVDGKQVLRQEFYLLTFLLKNLCHLFFI